MYNIITKGVIEIVALIFLILIPAVLFVVGIILLTRVFSNKNFDGGRQIPETTVRAKVLGKREEFMSAGQRGSMTFYYVTFELSKDDVIELKMPKGEFKKCNYADIVKLTHKGEKFIKLKIIEKSGNVTEPDYTYGNNFTDMI